MSSPQPGWYPNPDGSPDLRYWDGTAWTQQRRPAPPQTPQAEPSTPEPTVVFPPREDIAVEPLPGTAADHPVTDSSAQADGIEPQPPEVATDASVGDGMASGTVEAPPESGTATPEGDTQHAGGEGIDGQVPAGPSGPLDEQPAPVTGETMQFPPEPPPTRDTTVFPDQAQAGPPVAAAPLTPPPAPAPPTPPPPPVVPPPVMPPSAGYTAPPAQGYGQQYPPSAGLTPPAPYYPPAATTPVTSGSGVGVAALVVGILAVILSFSCFFFPFIPIVVAIAAGVLGIIGINQANAMTPPASKGMPVTGLILGGVALAVSVLFVVLLVVGTSTTSGF